MALQAQLLTADDLLDRPKDGFCYELIQGELRQMSPAGHHHGRLAIRVGASLERYVYEHDLGEVYAAETGFILARNPDTVRAPDAAFVRKERAATVGNARGYYPGAPDLVVEVVLPNDRYSEVRETVAAWLGAGTQLVVVVDARHREIIVHEPNGTARTLRESDILDGGAVVLGWSLPVRAIFE